MTLGSARATLMGQSAGLAGACRRWDGGMWPEGWSVLQRMLAASSAASVVPGDESGSTIAPTANWLISARLTSRYVRRPNEWRGRRAIGPEDSSSPDRNKRRSWLRLVAVRVAHAPGGGSA